MRLEQFYQEVILDHYKHPQHRGLREPFGAQVYHVNPTCGDEITLRVTVSDDGDRIADVSYDGQGCSISQASTSVLATQMIGLRVPQAMETFDAFHEMVSSRGTVDGDEEVLGDGIAFAGVAKYPARVKCALLGWMAFKDALAQALAAEPATASVLVSAGTEGHALAPASAATQAPTESGAGSTMEMDR